MNIKEKWNYICIHIWLLFSSYGIIFAILSFLEDLGILSDIINNYRWIKGVSSIIFGILFYFTVGIPHLNGTKNL